jgi:hypothetical protein
MNNDAELEPSAAALKDAVAAASSARRAAENDEVPDGRGNARSHPPSQLDETGTALVLAGRGSADTLDQAIWWKPGRWISGLGESSAASSRIRPLASTCGWTDDSGSDAAATISRRQVLDQDDPEMLFLASLIWGFGTTGYGWSRTARILQVAGERSSTLTSTVEAYRVAARVGPEAVYSTWTSGPHQISGLYTAFASKVAYFASYPDEAVTVLPLISDLNTRWGMWVLTGFWVPEPRYRSKGSAEELKAAYSTYVHWCHDAARSLELAPHDVELSLFQIGKLAH